MPIKKKTNKPKFLRKDLKLKFKKIIICTLDGTRHIDKGRFAKNPHKKHLCIRKENGKKIKHFFTVSSKSIGV